MKHAKSSVVLVFNKKGKLVLQLRGRTDKKYPGHWDFSAAGGIEENEHPELAALRELKEEIGISAKLEYVSEIEYIDEKGSDYVFIFKTVHDGPYSPDGFEVERVATFSLKEIDMMLKSGEKFHPEFPFLWEKGLVK